MKLSDITPPGRNQQKTVCFPVLVSLTIFILFTLCAAPAWAENVSGENQFRTDGVELSVVSSLLNSSQSNEIEIAPLSTSLLFENTSKVSNETTTNVSTTLMQSTALSATGGVITATDDVFLTVANDAGVHFNDFGNNTFHILWTGGGLNALHISNGTPNYLGQYCFGEPTTTSNQSGTFYVTTTGGRGYQDDIFLCVAVNGTVPDEFRLHLVATGCQWTPSTSPRTIPDAITYNATTLDEWFTKDDLIYGPQTWRPAAGTTYPLYYGQNVSDTSNQFRMMFIDLNGGILTDYPMKVRYEFQYMNTSASFDVYGYAQHPDTDVYYVNSWTNCLTKAVGDNSGWFVSGVPLEPPARVNISSSDIELPLNGKKTFTATAYDTYDEVVDGAVLTWTSSNTTVGTIDQNGLFTPKALGETEINVTCTGGASDSVHVTVVPAVPIVLDSIALSPSSLYLYTDDTSTYRLNATGYDQFGDVYAVDAYTWSSTNETVCTVNATGFVSLVGAGNATISATNGAVSGTAPVTISVRPDWTLNLIGAVNQTLNRTEFIDLARAYPASYTDNKGYVWEGVNLSVLIGLVDDADPATLNRTLVNDLYRIFVNSSQVGEGSTITSDELVGNETFVVAYTLNGEEIPDISTYWPLKLHGSGCALTSRSLNQVTKIEFAIRPHVGKINISEMIQAWDYDSAPISISIHAYDDSGAVLSDTKYVLDYVWTSSNESVGVVDEYGNFSVKGAGKTQITAQLGDKTTTIDAVVYASAENSHQFSVDETGETGFKTIAEALEFAQDGDVIVVKNGTYDEALTIDKAITIRSENGASGVIIPAAVNINADNVFLEGLTINNQVNVNSGSEDCVIDHCVVDYYNKSYGVIYLYSGSSNCTISNNTVINTNGMYGIFAYISPDNLIVNNSVEAKYGIYAYLSEGNIIKDNDIQGCLKFASAPDTIVENNTVTPSYKKYAFYVHNCQNGTFVNNTITGSAYNYVMYLDSAPGSKFCNNRISGGTTATIYAVSSVSQTSFYLNEISGTAATLLYGKSTTTLNSVDPVTYVYNNNTYTGILGNHYSDYAGNDADGDGIGETPYTGTKITDSYPLVSPIAGYRILESAPKVIVAPASATLHVDESMNFTVNVYDADGVLMSGAVPVWSSSNTTVGVVDAATGFFEALSAGTTTVAATAEGVTSLAHVTVTLPDVPVASFTAMPLSGDAPLYVQFTDTSTGSITSRSWDFDNDGVIDSTEQNATHTYTAAGNYTVNLTVANAAGSNTTVKTDYITVSSGGSGGDAPVANFSADVTNGTAPLNVTFIDLSTNAPTSWLWDFGDGTNSTERNATHTYTTAGNYTVNLTATNDGGSDTATKTDYITVTTEAAPDLTVSTLAPNNDEVFSNSDNTYTAKVTNIGTGDAGAFAVGFNVSGATGTVAVPDGLAAGANTTVIWTDETVRTAGDLVTVTVVADADGVIAEADEENNLRTVEKTVVHNGYRGERWTGGDDLNTTMTCDVRGDLLWSAGDSAYLSSTTYPDWTTCTANWTATDLPVPGNATIAAARLYVSYTWDKGPVFPANVSLTFNGAAVEQAAAYADEKMWGSSYPYGMTVYDVTDRFSADGNAAVLTSTFPGGGNVSVRGMLLAVVYDDGTAAPHTVLINEGFDLLYGGASQGTTPEQAMAYAPFNAVETAKAVGATLVTVAPGAGPQEGDLLFNGETFENAWNYTGTSQIGVDERDVTSFLLPSENTAAFRSSGDYMEAAAAFLVVEYPLPTGSIAVASTPAGAAVWLDGTDTGQVTGCTLENVPAGDHVVTLKLDGYADASTPVTVAEGETATVDLTLTTLTGSIAVASTPDGAAIFIDGAETGNVTNATLDGIAVGAHNVTLKKDGYRDATAEVTIAYNETATLHLDLVEAAGSIAVASTPDGAAIYLDGTDTGRTTNATLENVPVGDHVVTVKKAGYADASTTVTVADNETATASFTLTAPAGSILVTTAPDGARIYLDGTDTGEVTNTTLTTVPVGDHTVRVELEGYQAAEKTVTVNADEVAEAAFTLEASAITLVPGWNFISTPKRLADGQDTVAIFDEVDTAGHSVLLYDGQDYKWRALSSTAAFQPLDGIWIYANASYTIPLTFAAGEPELPPTKDLGEGWNAIGFTDTVPESAATTLSSVSDAWTTLFGFDAETQEYDVSIIRGSTGRHGEERTMQPMQGYWIYMTTADTLAAI